MTMSGPLTDRETKDYFMETVQRPQQHIAITRVRDTPDIRLLSIPVLTEHAAHVILAKSAKDLRRATHQRMRQVLARQVAMYLAHVSLGLTLTQTGALFARDRTTVAYGCGVVEDRRDDPELDLALDVVGVALRWRLQQIAFSGVAQA
jgi:chromosomal replication initiation ATPase DnaA